MRQLIDYHPLQNSFVRLEPFASALKEKVRAAIDCDPDTWALMGSVRVQFRVDTRNKRSQAATMMFSILDREWPAVKQSLEARLKAF